MKRRKGISPGDTHRRQLIWQIWVPLGASILIVLALAGLSVAGVLLKSDQIERWGNLSAVWVILPVLLAGFIFLAIVIACVYGLSKLLVMMPGWMLKLQNGIERVGQITRNIADRSTQPVIAVNGVQARVETLWKKIFG